MTVDFNIMAGGEAGQGVQSVGMILAKAMARGGLHVFADQRHRRTKQGTIRTGDHAQSRIVEPTHPGDERPVVEAQDHFGAHRDLSALADHETNDV